MLVHVPSSDVERQHPAHEPVIHAVPAALCPVAAAALPVLPVDDSPANSDN